MDVQITVDDDVFAVLKSQAEPFVDTPNSVLRRLLQLQGATASPPANGSPPFQGTRARTAAREHKQRGQVKEQPARTRVPSGTLLPEERYEVPLLRALVAAGGQGRSKEIIDGVGRELKDDLTPLDLERLTSGGVRWQSRIQFVRLRLIERELMDRNTPRGTWAISDKGREHAASRSNDQTV